MPKERSQMRSQWCEHNKFEKIVHLLLSRLYAKLLFRTSNSRLYEQACYYTNNIHNVLVNVTTICSSYDHKIKFTCSKGDFGYFGKTLSNFQIYLPKWSFPFLLTYIFRLLIALFSRVSAGPIWRRNGPVARSRFFKEFTVCIVTSQIVKTMVCGVTINCLPWFCNRP